MEDATNSKAKAAYEALPKIEGTSPTIAEDIHYQRILREYNLVLTVKTIKPIKKEVKDEPEYAADAFQAAPPAPMDRPTLDSGSDTEDEEEAPFVNDDMVEDSLSDDEIEIEDATWAQFSKRVPTHKLSSPEYIMHLPKEDAAIGIIVQVAHQNQYYTGYVMSRNMAGNYDCFTTDGKVKDITREMICPIVEDGGTMKRVDTSLQMSPPPKRVERIKDQYRDPSEFSESMGLRSATRSASASPEILFPVLPDDVSQFGFEEDDDALTRMSGDIKPTYMDSGDESDYVRNTIDRFSVERRGRSASEYNFRHRLDQINMYEDELDMQSDEAPVLPERPETPLGGERPPRALYPRTQQEAIDRGESMITPILIGLAFLVLANYTTMS